MNDEEFRAIIAQGPAVVMVESRHMIALLDERDGFKAENARLREAVSWYAKDYDYKARCSQWDGGAKARAALDEKP